LAEKDQPGGRYALRKAEDSPLHGQVDQKDESAPRGDGIRQEKEVDSISRQESKWSRFYLSGTVDEKRRASFQKGGETLPKGRGRECAMKTSFESTTQLEKTTGTCYVREKKKKKS